MLPYSFKTPPYQHQLAAFERTAEQEYWALTMEQGTGKTKVALDTSGHLYNQGHINAILVLAPNGVHRNWIRKEVPAHLPDYIPRTCSAWQSNTTKKWRQQHDAVFKGDGLRILTINIEAMVVPRVVEEALLFVRANDCLVVVDESQRIKTPPGQSKRSKNVHMLRSEANVRRILTGTPVTQSPLDVFSQYTFLDPDFFHTRSFAVFRARYAELMPADHPLMQHIARTTGKHAPALVATDANGRPIYKNLEELRALTDAYSTRVLKRDCLDLPDKIYYRRPVEMNAQQAKLYADLRRRLKTGLLPYETAGKELTKLNSIMYLQRILCGTLPAPMAEDGQNRPFLTWQQNPRVEALLDELAESGEQAIIWCRFTDDIHAVTAALTKVYGEGAVVQYYGEMTSTTERDRSVDRFQSGQARFFVGNPDAGGTGLTLTAAGEVHYFSNSFKLETRLQSEDRAHRIGQTKSVRYVDYEVEGTVDTKIIQAFLDKKDVADAITGDTYEEWL